MLLHRHACTSQGLRLCCWVIIRCAGIRLCDMRMNIDWRDSHISPILQRKKPRESIFRSSLVLANSGASDPLSHAGIVQRNRTIFGNRMSWLLLFFCIFTSATRPISGPATRKAIVAVEPVLAARPFGARLRGAMTREPWHRASPLYSNEV